MSKLSRILCILSCTIASTQAFADTNYDLKDVISGTQPDEIIKNLLKIAPSGTEATNVTFKGFFTLSTDKYLTAIDITEITFTVTTNILFFSTSSDVTLSIAGVFPTLDCNKPQIIRANVTGTNSLFDDKIRQYLNKHARKIFTRHFIGQTDLLKYCKIKPKLNASMEEEDFEF